MTNCKRWWLTIRKLTIDEVRGIFAEHNCELLEEQYSGNRQPLRFRCSCGREAVKSLEKYRRTHKCQECAVSVKHDAIRLTIDEVRQRFEDAGCELLSDSYVNNHTPLKYRCSCGNVSTVRLSKFMAGNRCRRCGDMKRSGENSSMWNQNKTIEERIVDRHYPEYQEWRRAVFSRDDYTCQCCNQRGNKIHAHHMFSYATHPELRLEVDNGITLCVPCHKEFHKKHGKTNNSRQQMAAFLSDKFREQKQSFESHEKEVS